MVAHGAPLGAAGGGGGTWAGPVGGVATAAAAWGAATLGGGPVSCQCHYGGHLGDTLVAAQRWSPPEVAPRGVLCPMEQLTVLVALGTPWR